MIRTFLTRRMMQFKVDSTLSSERHLKGGAPQGTLLGNYLFILATNDLELRKSGVEWPIEMNNAMTNTCLGEDLSTSSMSSSSDEPVPSVSTPSRRLSGYVRFEDTISDDGDDDSSFIFLREFRNPHNRINDTPDMVSFMTLNGSAMNEGNPPKRSWKKLADEDLKYIDDIMSLEHLAVTGAYNIFSTNKPEAIIHAQRCERFFPLQRPMRKI